MSRKKWTLSVESKEYHLESGRLYLMGYSKDGEDSNQHVDIPLKSQNVDRKHCIADVTDHDLYIYDLHTEFGTFVNGKRLPPMLKEWLSEDSELRIGDATAKLTIQTLEAKSEIETFLVPTHKTPRSSLSNTSTRLFSSPDVSLLSDARNCSFSIPETQHPKQQSSIVNSSVLNSPETELNVEKNFEGDSFIPETQDPVQQGNKTLELEGGSNQYNDMIRICTQDFNENLFENGGDEMLFSSLVIPQIQHKTLILPNIPEEELLNKNGSSTIDAEMDALNWSAQTSKNANSDGAAQTSGCDERDNTTTPDLFDPPQIEQTTSDVLINQGVGVSNGISSNEKASSVYNDLLKTVEEDGEGYAEEIDLMPTQVFIPMPKLQNNKSTVQVVSELSLSGKENLPQPDIDLNATQVFAPNEAKPKKSSSTTSRITEASINELSEGNCIWLAPTQLITKKISNAIPQFEGSEKSKSNICNVSMSTQKASISVQMEAVEKQKSLLSSMEITKNTYSNNRKNNSKKDDCFKKPEQSSSSSTSRRNASSICSSQSESEDLQLCTPKWISDNIDELPVERTTTCAKRRMLFGSDSEEEFVALDKLNVKKDSKDFDTLLSNVKEGKLETKFRKPKSLSVKKEDLGQINNVNKSKKKPNKTQESIVKSEDKNKSNGSVRQELNATKSVSHETKVVQEQRTKKQIEEGEGKRSKTVESKVDKYTEVEGEPVRRITRLKSKTSEKEYNVDTSLSGPSQAKMRKIGQSEDPDSSTKRVTRSRSKTDSQESVTPTRLTSSSCSTSKVKVVLGKETRKKIEADNEKNKKEKLESLKSFKDIKSKSSSDDELRKLRSNGRTLQIAKTMVDEEVFRNLVENSAGKWRVANEPTGADVLVMDRGNRTLKFLIAMAKGIPIVTTKWLESFNTTKVIPRGISLFFKDHDFEKRHKFSLLKSLELARKRKLFDGYKFFTTPSISPAPAEMRQILECAGGTVYTEPQSPKDGQNIYLISTMNDKKYWHKYRQRNSAIRIINSEGVMTAVMRQTPTLLDSHIFA